MSELILHHYTLSPFSRKVRSVLGYTQLPWQSALTREMPPRPVLDHLVGGYRKIPVAQIGSDVFCDSRTICTEIAQLANKPELDVANVSGEIQAFVSEADVKLFFACIGQSVSWKLNKKVLKQMSLLDLAKFMIDRINIGRNMKTPVLKPAEAKVYLKNYVADLEQRLEQQPFLFGSSPNAADFAVYHCFWFMRDVAEKPTFGGFEKFNGWLDRIAAFGEGNVSEINAESTLEIARASEPRPIDDQWKQDSAVGQQVSIAPADYACDTTQGIQVGSSDDRWIISRSDSAVGKVHVHFPKQGFALKPL